MKAPPLNLINTSSASSAAMANATPATTAATAEPRPASAPASIAPEPGLQELNKIADRLREQIGTAGQQIQFAVDDSSGKAIMRIIDIQTNTVLRQVPGDEAMVLARAMESMQGVLIRQKA